MLLKETYRQIDTLLVVMRLPCLFGMRLEGKNSGEGQKSTERALCIYVLHSLSRVNFVIFICCRCELSSSFHFSCTICADLLGK
jgi:hypothetical protein